jgi:hypothetical protein
MLIAIDTLADPNTFPTTVGIVEKNPPLETPLMITKAIIGASVVEAGHRASMLNAVSERERKSVFSGPSLSQRIPHPILPIADEKLKPATKAAPVLDDRPIDLEYSGKKKGGTKRGNVPTAPAMKMITKVNDLNKRLSFISVD